MTDVLLRFGIRRVDSLILESLTASPSRVEQVSCSDNRRSYDYRCAEAEETTGNRNAQQICPPVPLKDARGLGFP